MKKNKIQFLRKIIQIELTNFDQLQGRVQDPVKYSIVDVSYDMHCIKN